MQNITSSRWTDNVTTSLNEVENILCAHHPDDISGNSTNYINWKIKKSFDENKTMVLNGKKVNYNHYLFSFDQITVGQSSDDEPIQKNGFLIAYFSGGKVHYIINRNSGALTILRKLLMYTGKCEIQKDTPSFAADMFVWIISKVYKGDNIIESDSANLENLTIDSVRGFKGDTEDLLTRVSAVGESVMNIISTLSFLLESQKLNQITLDLAYREHKNIDVLLSNKNCISINFERYIGPWMAQEEEDSISKIFLLLYAEVIPLLIQSYQIEIEGLQWSQNECITFLESVATGLSEKVTNRVQELKEKPQQMRIDMQNHPEETDIAQ